MQCADSNGCHRDQIEYMNAVITATWYHKMFIESFAYSESVKLEH